MGIKRVFERKETKYILCNDVFEGFIHDLKKHMEVDEYGLHTIHSIYYDTSNFQFIQHSMDKPVYKEKFRVRIYDANPELVFLEIKKKVRGIVYKRRLPMEVSEFHKWEKSRKLPFTLASTQIGKEIDWLFKKNPDLTAKVLITYDRVSMMDPMNSEFRVTFDRQIRYQTVTPQLADNQYELVAPELGILMEVKAMGAYPLWFVRLLGQYQLYKANFSKYAQTYQRHLIKEEYVHVS